MATNFTRKNLKEFSANNKSGLQVFGSRASNSPSNSSDPEILQSNPNFELGWRGATLLNPDNSTRLPQIDEMAALDYIHNYALNYILQKGIPEYNAATSYFIGDLARDAGGTEIYKSITDDNLGNALNDTANWEFQGDLSLLKNVPSNTIIVNSEADLPPAVGSVITFGAAENGKTYKLNETLVYDKEFVVEDGIDVKFTSVNLNKAWVYIGTGTMLTSSDFNIIDIESTIFLAPAGQKFNTSGTGTLIITKSFLAGANIGGTLNNSFTTMKFVDFSDYGQGFTVGADFAFSINSASSAFWRNEIATMFTFSSPTTEIVLTNFGFTPDANETALDFDQSLRTTDATIIMGQCPFDLSLGGVALAANGLDQKYAGSSFQNNEGLENSTVSLKITFEGNSSPTTITVAGQNEPISLNTTYAIDDSIERFVLQDLCTFDFTTDTISTAFNHGLSNGDIIQFSTYTGTLPTNLDNSTRYFIINSAAATFQVSLTQGGPAVDFSDNGAGTLYYRHITGVSVSGEAIYVGRENVVIKPAGWVSIINTANANDGVRGAIMKIDANGNIIENQAASLITVNNTRPQSSVVVDSLNLSTGEGIVIYIRNDDATNNLIAEENILTLTKV